MAIYSLALNNQALSPAAQYHIASLNDSVLGLKRRDIENWDGANNRALGQDLTTVGWMAGTRVAIVVNENTVLYDTLTSATYTGGNTALVFDTYTPEARRAQEIYNLDYLNYLFRLKIETTMQETGIGTAAITETYEVVLYPAANGWAMFDVCAYLRDKTMRKDAEIRDYGIGLVLSPVESEHISVIMSVRCEANGQTTAYGWDGVSGDDAVLQMYRMRELNYLITDDAMGPLIFPSSIQDAGQVNSGHMMWEPGALPLVRAVKDGANWVVPYCLPFHYQSASPFLHITASLVGVAAADYTITEEGNFYLFDQFVTASKPTRIDIDKDVDDTSNLIPFSIEVETIDNDCNAEAITIVWRNSIGGWNIWTFANEYATDVATDFAGQPGDVYSAMLNYVPDNYGLRNRGAFVGGQRRTLSTNRAKNYTMNERSLKREHLLYLRSLIATEEAYIVNPAWTDILFFPVLVTEGEAQPVTTKPDLYTFTATIKLAL